MSMGNPPVDDEGVTGTMMMALAAIVDQAGGELKVSRDYLVKDYSGQNILMYEGDNSSMIFKLVETE